MKAPMGSRIAQALEAMQIAGFKGVRPRELSKAWGVSWAMAGELMAKLASEGRAFKLSLGKSGVLYFATDELRTAGEPAARRAVNEAKSSARDRQRKARNKWSQPTQMLSKKAEPRYTAGSSKQAKNSGAAVITSETVVTIDGREHRNRWEPTGPVPRVVDSSQCRPWAQYA